MEILQVFAIYVSENLRASSNYTLQISSQLDSSCLIIGNKVSERNFEWGVI